MVAKKMYFPYPGLSNSLTLFWMPYTLQDCSKTLFFQRQRLYHFWNRKHYELNLIWKDIFHTELGENKFLIFYLKSLLHISFFFGLFF